MAEELETCPDCGAEKVVGRACLFEEHHEGEDREDDGAEIVLDLSHVPDEPPVGASGDENEPPPAYLEARLQDLLALYGFPSQQKAERLVATGAVELVDETGQAKTYVVAGSRPYSVKVTRGEDFVFVECSCPNGSHRGGEPSCYHSLAARVVEAGLVQQWLNP